MNYEEAIEYIHSFQRTKRPLSATKKLLEKLGSPEKKLRYVHVAGTNGKGSTSAMIESVLRAAGYCTGLFTSPFVTRFNERIRVDGADIGDNDLAELVTELKPIVEAESEPLSEFEFVTVLGLTYFARRGCNIAVIECGLGGRNDCTNVIPAPEVCVFTAIGLDHTKLLGSTVSEIAREKSGIIKPGTAAVSFGNSEEAERVLRARCVEVGARYIRTNMSSLEILGTGMKSCLFSYSGIENIRLPLAGAYQPYNAANAVTALRVLADIGWFVSDESIRDGLERMSWKGRFELLSEKPDVILDGAHNPQACKATVDSLIEKENDKKIVFVIAVMADKDVNGIVSELLRASDTFVCVPLNYPRAMPKVELCKLIKKCGGNAITADSISAGVSIARQLAGKDGVVCCLGTLYFQNDVRASTEGLEMRELFSMDKRDYDGIQNWFVRPSVRAIITRDGKILMVRSKTLGFCKFPGGGIEAGESHIEALAREVGEESGYLIAKESVRPFGMVHRVQKGDMGDIFLQDNFYYTCEIADQCERRLDDYEREEGFEPEWLTIDEAIKINAEYRGRYADMILRERRVLEIIKSEL
ncbi:MAG: NUDIX domain-containing protein [Oscillospiraceae bacterium]|nr:NUDIX domain-containing protein [Oscillospiraceae bacterium]